MGGIGREAKLHVPHPVLDPIRGSRSVIRITTSCSAEYVGVSGPRARQPLSRFQGPDASES